jgi:hypothetical protein
VSPLVVRRVEGRVYSPRSELWSRVKSNGESRSSQQTERRAWPRSFQGTVARGCVSARDAENDLNYAIFFREEAVITLSRGRGAFASPFALP